MIASLSFLRLALKASLGFTSIALATGCLMADSTPPAQLASNASRLVCKTGDAVMVNEFTVQGTTSKTFLLRAIGPSLRAYGVPDPLRDPTITLLNARGTSARFQ